MAHAGHQWRASGTAALGMEAVGKQKPQPWGRGGWGGWLEVGAGILQLKQRYSLAGALACLVEGLNT
jgi:hypothetical protein